MVRCGLGRALERPWFSRVGHLHQAHGASINPKYLRTPQKEVRLYHVTG